MSKNKKNSKEEIKKYKEVIPQAVKTAVWNKYVGIKKGTTHCFVGCGNVISQHNFECGHIQAEAQGGEVSLDNLRPICSNCNKSIGKKNMLDFIAKYKFVKHKNWNADKINENKCTIL